jgi:GT2 family glycosyltransferase/peptidoglycan/xylan/chitin deacetylase (PgdA/CDA1 family)
MNLMLWSIVITTYRRPGPLRALLQSLELQTINRFEVIVVIDGEDDQTRTLSGSFATRFSITWIFQSSNTGLAAARNAGARVARGEMLLFLDDDVIPSPNLLFTHEIEHTQAPNWPPSVAYGRTIEERQVPIVSKTDEFLQQAWEQFLTDYHPDDITPDADSIGGNVEAFIWCGMNCSIRRNVFEEAGGFDSVLRTDEEMELGLRLFRKGVAFRYVKDAVVRHKNTKVMTKYVPQTWKLRARLDVYRARDLGQRSIQNSYLTRMRNGPMTWRWLANFAWRNPDACRALALFIEGVNDRTGSPMGLRLWTRLRNAVEYWEGVKESGITQEQLNSLVEPVRRIVKFASIAKNGGRTTWQSYQSERFRRRLTLITKLGYKLASPQDWFAVCAAQSRAWIVIDARSREILNGMVPICEELAVQSLIVVDVGACSVAQHQENQPRLFTPHLLRGLGSRGFSFGMRPTDASRLLTLSTEELRQTIKDGKSRLEDQAGMAIDWFVYPPAQANRRTRAVVTDAGFRAAVTEESGLNRWEDPLALKCIPVCHEDSYLEFLLKLRTGREVEGVRDAAVRKLRRLTSVASLPSISCRAGGHSVGRTSSMAVE